MVLKLKVSPDVSCLSVCAYEYEHTNPTYFTEMEVTHHITEAPSEGFHRQAYGNDEAILIRAILCVAEQLVFARNLLVVDSWQVTLCSYICIRQTGSKQPLGLRSGLVRE